MYFSTISLIKKNLLNMKTSYFVLFLFFLAFTNIIGQESEVAKIGNDKISSNEFLKRFELTPRVRTSANIDTQKTQFLQTLIAEKLWAKEARNLYLDTLYSYRQYKSNLEKMLVRDALFKKEIESKLSIDEKNIQSALNKRKYELRLKFLFSKSKFEIDSLYARLKDIKIDSILIGRQEKLEQADPITVQFGQMNESLEDSLYRLSIGEYTKPIFMEIGWVIYYMADKIELSGSKIGDRQTARSEVINIIRERQNRINMKEYLAKHLSNVDANTDGQLFRLLSTSISQMLSDKYQDTDSEIYYLYEDDIIQLINSFSGKVNATPFIKFTKNPVTFKEFMYYLYFNNFKAGGTDITSVQGALNSTIRDFIRFEILAREGYSQKLNTLPEISAELQMWEDNFLSQYLRNTYNSKAKVSQSELDKYISEEKGTEVSSKYISLTEVKLSNLDQAQYILTQLQYNYNLEDILDKMNFPQSSILKSDGLQPLSSFGELIEIIEKMKDGEIYGPIVRTSGYSIIKLNKSEERVLSSEEKNKLQVDTGKEILFYKKLKTILDEKTVELAQKYGLKINEQVLNSIRVTEIPTLIYRYYGFGGQTVAAPFLNLFYDWYDQYKNESKNPL